MAEQKHPSLRVIILLGIISLFSDVVYEGARSITGPYLGALGATGAVVGFVAGFSEMLGYAIRLVSGKLAGESRFIWPSLWLGYLLNLLSIPGLALANSWPVGAGLMFTERLGKGIRTPARDLVLSEAAGEEKRGFAFGLHHTLDQIGAVSGPLIVSAILLFNHSYQVAFASLLIPGVLALVCLAGARMQVDEHKQASQTAPATQPLPKAFWWYCAAVGLVGAGFVDFPLIAFSLSTRAHVASGLIPLLYAFAMGAEAAMAIPLGHLFDKHGMKLLRAVAWICVPTALAIFSSNWWILGVGAILWGTGMVFQQSLAKAMVSQLVPPAQRSFAFGAFGLLYGICWFCGSFAIGLLYDHSLHMAIALSVALEAAGAAILLRLKVPTRDNS